MKLKEGELKSSRGWEYKEIYIEFDEQYEQLSFLEDFKDKKKRELQV